MIREAIKLLRIVESETRRCAIGTAPFRYDANSFSGKVLEQSFTGKLIMIFGLSDRIIFYTLDFSTRRGSDYTLFNDNVSIDAAILFGK